MREMKKIFLMAGVASLAACAPQSTPSMMNIEKPRLVQETTLEQVALKDAGDGYLAGLAERYRRYGTEAMQVSLAYDPTGPYTAVKAFSDLAAIKDRLRGLGVRNIQAETVQADIPAPTLMISFDGISAVAPAGCTTMPGMADGMTTRHVGSYKFGCTVDSLLAQQLYRPADLMGADKMDPIDGRKTVTGIEFDRVMSAEEAEGPLNVYGRQDIEN